jgi:pimeloyl-ACP methyl ester carboxylesterase/DNA-binding CsgD family transcriptional regulator
MDAPPVQYVRTSDGYDIAYGVSGDGPTLVFAGAGFMHFQLAWKLPRLRDWLNALAARFEVVQLDMRGAGLSSRDLPGLSVEDYQRDMGAVIEHLGLERFVLYAHSFLPTCIATQYAVSNPGRVSALILSAAVTALGSQRAPSLFAAFPNEDWDIFLRTLIQVGMDPESPEQTQEMVELWRQAFDQRDFLLMVAAANRFSLPDLLPNLTTPSLVLTTRSAGLYPLEQSLEVARLAGAKLVSLDGKSSYGDAEQGMRAIEAFLAGLPSVASPTVPAHATPAGSLSARELEVLRLIAAGRSNPQIAAELVISLNTVQRHVSNILAKTGAANRTEAAGYARDRGLI